MCEFIKPGLHAFMRSIFARFSNYILNSKYKAIIGLSLLCLISLGNLSPISAHANEESHTIKKKDLMRCWEREFDKSQYDMARDRTRPYFSLCLRNKDQAVGFFMRPEGHGGDFEYKWRLIKGPYIIFSDLGEKCRVSRMKAEPLSKEGIILSECQRFSGVYRRDDEAWQLELENDAWKKKDRILKLK